MQENLVIVESPAKAKTIEKFLGKDFKVMSSYGHIRDLKSKSLSIDEKTMLPTYEVPKDKEKVVKELKSAAKKAKRVWLASDEDREGEAISWHLCEVLGLDEEKTARIVFHEITKKAILNAIESPRHLDINLVNAQQARRVLDRLVGFKLSPVLWRKIKPALSAGRVQSVAVRLIVEREREVEAFNVTPFYRVNAIFKVAGAEFTAELDQRFSTQEEAKNFVEACRSAEFTVDSLTKKPLHRSPAPPFTTSTLQQEAARRLGYSVSQTMRLAQTLYESGLITYMRTDSLNLSELCINSSKEVITGTWGDDYVKLRRYHTNSKGAQEAHEAIRPTDMSLSTIELGSQEKRLYELIRRRTLASQMADAQIEKTTVKILISGRKETFVATGEVILFEGFLKVETSTYTSDNDASSLESALKVGANLAYEEITATERFTQAPARYSEASLVHRLEELGIGRPSTYAPTISTIQQRQYVEKGDKEGVERLYNVLSLKSGKITTNIKTEKSGSDKGKLRPTDIGTVVNDFLLEHFPAILDYNFTAKVEEEFDHIAEGKEEWQRVIKDFYTPLEKRVDEVVHESTEHRAGERELGQDPKTGKVVIAKIGRFGPLVQIGRASEEEKPLFAKVPKDKSISTITLDEALDLFKLPRTLGDFEDSSVVVNTGRFGPYIAHNKKFTSIPKGEDPMEISLERAIELILQNRETEKKKILRTFDEDTDMQVLNGRYGAYIAYKGKNYKLTKALKERASELSYSECKAVVKV